MLDYKAIGDTIIVTVRDYVARSVSTLVNRLDTVDKQLREVIAAQPETVRQVEQRLQDAITNLPTPKDGNPGKDADPEHVKQLVSAAVADIPTPQDGKSVTLDEVMPALCAHVKELVGAIPTPKDGASVTLEDLLPSVREIVKHAVDALPVPADGEPGRSVEPEEVKALVSAAVAEIPKPQNGKDADPEQIRAIAAKEVAKAVEQIVIPPSGPTEKDIESMLNAMVDKACKAIRVPEDGKSVPVEDVQRMIGEAVTKAISGIRMPKDGDPGRDATQIEILPAIDEQKSYVRGTYSKHAGGLWRSFETTTGMKGWECIIEGVKSLEITMLTERDGAVRIESSSGTVEEKTFTVPSMIYRNVFKEGNEYAQGDTVTWGGSLWHCNVPSSDKPGDGSKSWTLAAKKGRDGADAKQVAK